MTSAAAIDREPKQVRVITPELGLNKKLSGLKFNQIFDGKDIRDAENVVRKNENVFKVETAKDYMDFKTLYNSANLENLTKQDYEKFSAIAFSIKSRAGTGGFPLASEVANSLYQFCDKAAQNLPKNGYRALTMHFHAITEILEGRFEVNDEVKANKLVNGLVEISKKFSV